MSWRGTTRRCETRDQGKFHLRNRSKGLARGQRVPVADFLENAAKFMPRDQILIQDLIPGDGDYQYSFCSFFKQGQPQASVVTCRRRQHPFEFGRASTYVESVEMPLLEEYSTRFLREIDFYGLVEMEFKRDARDGQYRLLDVNGRTWGYTRSDVRPVSTFRFCSCRPNESAGGNVPGEDRSSLDPFAHRYPHRNRGDCDREAERKRFIFVPCSLMTKKPF